MLRRTSFRLLLVSVLLWVALPHGAISRGPILLAEEVGRAEAVAAMASPLESHAPAYDSGWIRVEAGDTVTLDHGLGGTLDDYRVVMDFRTNGDDGVNQRYYGGNDFGEQAPAGHSPEDRVGAYWHSLTTTSIKVYRRPEDTYAEQVRVRVIYHAPDWDSGWVALARGELLPMTHDLGGNSDDYVVDLQYRHAGSNVSQAYFGGLDNGTAAFYSSWPDDRLGACWQNLDNEKVSVFRRVEDIYAQEVRLRIWIYPRPSIGTGWVPLDQGKTLSALHYLGGDPDDYIVDMQLRSEQYGVNQRSYGGMDVGAHPPPGLSEDDRVGAYWSNLDGTRIAFHRMEEDAYAEEVHIRIWRFWTPTAADYSSGWVALDPGGLGVIAHGLGGDPDDYRVDLDYRGASDGVNKRFYGGNYFGSKSYEGTRVDQEAGARWSALTDSTITVVRGGGDTSAEQVRVRIWRMPAPDYDSGWVALLAGTSTTLSHRLGASTADYLVDMQYRDPSDTIGVNQTSYGGRDLGASSKSDYEDNRVGAYWYGLDESDVTVFRRPEDRHAREVRVRIWRMVAPHYDSNWLSLGQGQGRVLSPLGLPGGVGSYMVAMAFVDEDGMLGINQCFWGGNDFGAHPPAGYAADDRVGAHWLGLTSDAISVYRQPEDGYADWVRVRVWALPLEDMHLPMITRGYGVQEGSLPRVISRALP